MCRISSHVQRFIAVLFNQTLGPSIIIFFTPTPKNIAPVGAPSYTPLGEAVIQPS